VKSADFAVPHANAPERVAIGVKIATSSTRKSAGEHGGVPLTLKLKFDSPVWGVAEFEKAYAELERLKAGLTEIVQAIGEKQVLNKMRDAVRAHPTLLYYTPGFDSSSGAFYSAGGTLVPAAGQENTPLPLLQASLGSESRS
jgi:hypothetical protein